ncbi:MAG: hypothetical protein ACJ8KX_10150, partial [Chthoniobacterales bacterium]
MSRAGGFKSLGIWLGSSAALVFFVASVLQAQISDEAKKKRDAFLKAREEMHTIASPTPSESETPSGKPKPAKKKGTKGKKSPTPKDEDEEETPKPKAKKSPSPTPSKIKKEKEEEEEERKTPRPTAVPRPSEAELPPIPPSQHAPAATPAGSMPPADITIQKSGIEEQQGFEPPPPPPPRRSFWQRLFGGGDRTNYRYLSRNVIDAIRRAPV